ncbi:MAG: hypothetical protein JXK05_05400 [Campylobacterales bacterium]|nr:hypothetical protein [Campylobacterales bacterium]
MILFRLYLVLEWILMRLPRAARKGFFTFLGDAAYHLDPKHRRVIAQNVRFTLGDVSDAQLRRIGRYCYRNLMLSALQIMENRRNTRDDLALHVRFQNRSYVDDALAKGRKIVFISAHYGNWELGATALSALITPTHAVYKALSNPHFDRYLLESRSKLGMRMVEKHGAIKQMTRAIKNGESVSFLIDQNTSKREGIEVTFFGQKARQSAAPAYLARKYDALIIPLFIDTQNEEAYVITFETPLEVAHSDDAERDILETTQALSDLIERMIRREPKFWFWCHRRFKSEHPEIYRAS